MVIVRKIRENLVDAKDMDQRTASYFPRTVNLEENTPKDCFGPTDETDLQRDLETSNKYVTSDNYQRLLVRNLEMEEKEPENKNYLTTDYYPLWIRQMLDILTTEQGFNNLALPLINMIAEYPLIDPFTRIIRSPIYTPEGFRQCILQELQSLSSDEDVGLIAVDPAMIKEVNTYLGWQVSDDYLIKIYSLLAEHTKQAARSKSDSNKFYVMKEGGRIFIAIKGKIGEVGIYMAELRSELDTLCQDMIVPITGQTSLLHQRPDIIQARYRIFGTRCPKTAEFHASSSMTRFTYVHPNDVQVGSHLRNYNYQNPIEVQKAISVAMDSVRTNADSHKMKSYIKYLLHGKPEAFLFFDKFGSRFETRKAKARELIIEGILNNSLHLSDSDRITLRFIFPKDKEFEFIDKTIILRDQQKIDKMEKIGQRFRTLPPSTLLYLDQQRHKRQKR